MAKTGKQIQDDVYRLVKDSVLATMISGGVYKDGMRPRDSVKEDVVIVFTSGDTAQIQTGVVTVKIYVPDVDPFDNGVLVEDGERTTVLETAAQMFYESIAGTTPNYIFRLAQTVHTSYEQEINQHFVVLRLRFRYGENY